MKTIVGIQFTWGLNQVFGDVNSISKNTPFNGHGFSAYTIKSKKRHLERKLISY